jgi:DNA-binding NarL/FixJ family response regulator
MEEVKILLVDDHQIIQESVKLMLSDAEGVAWTRCAGNGEDALKQVRCLMPDIVITDISMPKMNGIELTEEIRRISPETKVLILTMYTYDDFIYRAIRAGAHGVLSKQDTTREVLKEAVAALRQGKQYFSPGISSQVMKSVAGIAKGRKGTENLKIPDLTGREREILRLYVEGYTNQEIADRLSISIRTVETHKANIMLKYNFKSTVEMVKFALRNNLVHLDQEPPFEE